MSNLRISKTAKLCALLLLVGNHLVAAAEPIATSDVVRSRFFFIIALAVALVVGVLYYLSKNKTPLEVVGLQYDRETNQIELKVRNNSDRGYCLKSAMRLIEPVAAATEAGLADSDGVSMSQGRADAGPRTLYQLLAEDDLPQTIAASETKTLRYDLILPHELAKLDDTKNVEVNLSYGVDEVETFLAPTKDDGIQKRTRIELADDVPGSCATISNPVQLLESLQDPKKECLEYQAENGADIGGWIMDAVDDERLGKTLSEVDYTSLHTAKEVVIDTLEKHLESKKHPYLRRVPSENNFVLKSSEDSLVSEVTHLEELAQHLEVAGDETITFHTSQRNDFEAWIRNSIGDESLAQTIQDLTSHEDPAVVKKHIVTALYDRIDELQD